MSPPLFIIGGNKPCEIFGCYNTNTIILTQSIAVHTAIGIDGTQLSLNYCPLQGVHWMAGRRDPTIFMEVHMPVHRMSDAQYTDLLRLILQEAHGIYVADRLAEYTPSHVCWLREWSMLVGYVELTNMTFDPSAPTGFALPGPHLTELGLAKLTELDQMYSPFAQPVKPNTHLMWFPGTRRHDH